MIKNKILNNKKNYLDSASAVPVLPEALLEFDKVSKEIFANSSSVHTLGEKSREHLDQIRKDFARVVRCRKNEMHFVSSSTEANNIFIKGVVLKYLNNTNKEKNVKVPHIITSLCEHSAILEPIFYLQTLGAEVSFVMPNKIGKIEVENIRKEIKENTVLVALSSVNSETGTVQNVREIARVLENFAKENSQNKLQEKPLLYIDASQAAEYESIDVGALLCDGMCFGARKLGGIAGSAALFVKKNIKLETLIHGGGQEGGIRSGTENIASLSSFLKVLQASQNKKIKQENINIVSELRAYAIEKIEQAIKENNKIKIELLGDVKIKNRTHIQKFFNIFKKQITQKYFENAAPHILLIHTPNLLGEECLLRLDAKGICVSTASACSILEGSGSNFLKSMDRENDAKETIRVSFSKNNTKKEIDYFVKTLAEILEKYQK